MASAVGSGNGTAGSTTAPARASATPDHHSGACLNCGARLGGLYCSDCGQSSHVHRTLASLVHDLLHGVFHFEGRIWRTVPLLVFHPGALTRRYIAGERARFVSPLALFLFTIFVMFAAFSAIGPGRAGKGIIDGWNSVDAGVQQERTRVAASAATLAAERARLAAANQSTAAVDRRMSALRERDRSLAAIAQAKSKLAVHSRIGWLDAGLQHASTNPSLVIYKVQSAAAKFSWALIVLSTPLVALLFLWRRGYGLYDHAIFVTYSISFMSLLAVAIDGALLLPGGEWWGSALLLVPPFHMFAQLRGAYRLSAFGAAWRTLVLLAGALVALVLFVVGVIAWEVA